MKNRTEWLQFVNHRGVRARDMIISYANENIFRETNYAIGVKRCDDYWISIG